MAWVARHAQRGAALLSRPRFLQAGLRSATSLPQIPGVVLTNSEVPDDRLVRQVRRWAKSSEVLTSGTFDLLQIAERSDGQLAPRAICGLLRTQLRLADVEEPVPAFAALFYRARDYLNQEFWEDQVRRLCDIAADEYFADGRGVQLMVHHNAPLWALGLEMGDHRLLAEFEGLHVYGGPWRSARARPAEPELCGEADPFRGKGVALEGGQAFSHGGFHALVAPEGAGEGAEAAGVAPGYYVLRGEGGAPTCGLRVLGRIPNRLLCSAPWAAEGHEADFGSLLDALRRCSGRMGCSVLADARDPHWERLCGRLAPPLPGLWRSHKRTGVVVTGVPVNLSPQEQAGLARAPFLMSWEFVPFHEGRVAFI